MKKINIFAITVLFVGLFFALATTYAAGLPKVCNIDGQTFTVVDGQPCTAPSTDLPVGCTSTSGYSLTTGQPCGASPVAPLPKVCNVEGQTFTVADGQPCVLPSTTSSITVLSPNGGEVFQPGQQITVKWNTTGISSNSTIRINLNSTNTQGYNFVDTENDGSETITLPTNVMGDSHYWPYMVYGQNFKISVSLLNNQTGATGISDVSDNLFTIQSSITSNESLQVISPNVGGIYTIKPDQKTLQNWFTYLISVPSALRQRSGALAKYIVQNPDINNLGSMFSLGVTYYPQSTSVVDSGGTFADFPYPDGKYYVMTQWVGQNGAEVYTDFSDAPFTIVRNNSPYPDGCTSGQGFSTTTGQRCSGNDVVPLPKVCNVEGQTFTVNDGQPCTTPSSDLPAGCTSTSGYSSTTGQSCSPNEVHIDMCPNIPGIQSRVPERMTVDSSGNCVPVSTTLPPGCLSTSGFSSTTGQPCSGSPIVPLPRVCTIEGVAGISKDGGPCTVTPPIQIGCSSTSGYSSTTGESCAGSSGQGTTISTDHIFTQKLAVGVRGQEVIELQKRLQIEGVFQGTVDGSFGPITRDAVKKFQAQHGIESVGIVGPKTLVELNK